MKAAAVVPSAWVEREGILWSPSLSSRGLVAGFTTRALGSMGGRATPPDEARARRDALAARLGFGAVVRVKQVHGNTVVRAPFVRSEDPWPEADGLWTDQTGVLLGVVAADCVPILVADGEGRIGAAHAGWDGTTKEVARHLIRAMREAGADPSRMIATLGPSIGPCCYEIGPDRAATIRERLGGEAAYALAERSGRITFDLWRANALQLANEGVHEIEVAGICAKSGGADLFSYRGSDAGLGLGFIGRRA